MPLNKLYGNTSWMYSNGESKLFLACFHYYTEKWSGFDTSSLSKLNSKGDIWNISFRVNLGIWNANKVRKIFIHIVQGSTINLNYWHLFIVLTGFLRHLAWNSRSNSSEISGWTPTQLKGTTQAKLLKMQNCG